MNRIWDRSQGEHMVSENNSDGARPLYCSIEMACNLVYLARHTEANLAQQRQYLDQALEVLFDLSDHPKLYD
jgi:hypothetical protein